MTLLAETRLSVANEALETFEPAIHLYEGERELRMCWDFRDPKPRHDFPARLRADGSWTQYGYKQRPTGGTGMQALAQLIRYVRDLPRLPLITWEYWAGERIALCNARTIEILAAGGYGDPEKTCCVLCGTRDFKRGLDWWSLDGVIGPSCYGGICRDARQLARDAQAVPGKGLV